MSMLNPGRHKSAQAERAGVVCGEAVRDPVSEEVINPRQDTESTGSALLEAVLTRENMQRAWKWVKANKGAAGGPRAPLLLRRSRRPAAAGATNCPPDSVGGICIFNVNFGRVLFRINRVSGSETRQ